MDVLQQALLHKVKRTWVLCGFEKAVHLSRNESSIEDETNVDFMAFPKGDILTSVGSPTPKTAFGNSKVKGGS